jgi:hypothetical protein
MYYLTYAFIIYRNSRKPDAINLHQLSARSIAKKFYCWRVNDIQEGEDQAYLALTRWTGMLEKTN